MMAHQTVSERERACSGFRRTEYPAPARQPDSTQMVKQVGVGTLRSRSELLLATPWIIAGVAVMALALQSLGRMDRVVGAGTEQAQEAADTEDRLLAAEAQLDKLVSKVDALAERVAKRGELTTNPNPPKPTNAVRSGAASQAAVEEDFEKLKQYVKDVADSIAVIDTQLSDPAVLQKKLEHERALARQ